MKFAVIDFETTGSSSTDTIIQVGLVIIDELEITNRYSSFVNPCMPIPEIITSLTGITIDMVKDAPLLEDVMHDLVPLLTETVLVGHHIPFDLSFLQKSLDETGYSPFPGKVLDTMDMLRMLFPSMGSFQLSMVSAAFNIPHERPHQADSDAEATALIWLHCLERLLSLPLITVQRLSYLHEPTGSDLSWFMQEIRSYKEMNAGSEDVTGQIFRQFSLKVTDWSEEEQSREKLDLDPLSADFDTFYEGFKEKLRASFDHFEEREAQDSMSMAVEDAFDSSTHLMVEAGTGTGKSLGYLIPSLYYGIKHDKKVVVSTHTINLQEQLRERDIPLLQQMFPVPFRAAVMKGRSHYLCLRKFEGKINNRDYDHLGKEDSQTASQMIVWLGETKTGDEEELNFNNKGAQFWHSVSSDADSCLNRHCPWFRKCYYHRAKHEAGVADVVITNHSMLFTDVKAENRLLPGYKHLVIDESHHFEEVAGKHLGFELSYFGYLGTMQWLYKDSRTGQLPALKARISKLDVSQERIDAWQEQIEKTQPKLLAMKENWDALSEKLYEVLVSRSNDPGQGENGQYLLRLKTGTPLPGWQELMELEERLYLDAGDTIKVMEKLLSDLKELDEDDIQGTITDLNGANKELITYRERLRAFLMVSDDGSVYWLEGGAYLRNKSLSLNCVPIDVSPLLQEYFFKSKDSVIMTSATLSVDKSFQYFAEQMGFKSASNADYPAALASKTEKQEEQDWTAVQLPSPFQYREQALVIIPRDFPTIKGASGDAVFNGALVDSLAEVAMAMGGRMLVLFTSSRMLKSVHGELKERLKPSGIGVLGQGVDSGNRSKLTRLFQDHPLTVLLGTSSFWEGVDIPGDALSCLAIVRLPFQPPNHPLVEAKCDKIKQTGGNPFMKLSVPQAVIRFKQGFGRLIRTTQDKGIVLIYDTRVIETRYGKYFLYSLPGPKIEHMNRNLIVPRIHEWMEGNRQ
jgi:ATP-dependent DNA helicase DinG